MILSHRPSFEAARRRISRRSFPLRGDRASVQRTTTTQLPDPPLEALTTLMSISLRLQALAVPPVSSGNASHRRSSYQK